MIDLHAHVLAAIDDGPTTLEEAVGQLTAAAAAGVSVVAATPHVSERYPTTPEAMERALAELVAEVSRAAVPLRVVPGGEISAAVLGELSPDDLRRFSLGGGGRYVLVELPSEGASTTDVTRLRRLVQRGLRPVIAHPERQADIQGRLGLAGSLVEHGFLLQVTASSLVGHHGRAAAATARALLEHELVHLIASDMHGRTIRRAGLGEGGAAVGDRRLASWLTVDVPTAVVAGLDLPARPAPKRRLRLW